MFRKMALICAMSFAAVSIASAAEIELAADLSARKLTVYMDGEVHETYDVAVGQDEHPTPTGTFTVRRIIWNPDWVPPDTEWAEGKEKKGPGDPDNPMKTAKIFFDQPDYYIHGTDATDSLGGEESHGCLRMNRWEVADLAKLLMEHNGESRDQSWYDEVIENDLQKEVMLDSAVRFRITE